MYIRYQKQLINSKLKYKLTNIKRKMRKKFSSICEKNLSNNNKSINKKNSL